MAKQNNGYGKRPMWQWIVLYVVIAVIVYGAIYYFYLAKRNLYQTDQTGSAETNTRNSLY
jgi:hypothetical protein